MKIGQSLSFCVLDIARGHVDIHDILVIVTRTKASGESEFTKLVDQYKRNYWSKDDPEKCQNIAYQLWRLGKIHQPRLFNDQLLTRLIPNVNWVDVLPASVGNPMVQEAYETYAALMKLHAQS